MSDKDQEHQEENIEQAAEAEQAQAEVPETEKAAVEPEVVAEQVEPKPEVSVDEALLAEVAAAKDEAMRAKAEMQNVRRRAEKDVENARRYSLERMAKEILPVVDNLERALESAGEEQTALVEGVELTLKTMLDVLGKQNIEQISPAGEPFDPQQHEAISMVPNPDAEPNTVLDVVQKGYTLNGRVIRAAMVVVCQN